MHLFCVGWEENTTFHTVQDGKTLHQRLFVCAICYCAPSCAGPPRSSNIFEYFRMLDTGGGYGGVHGALPLQLNRHKKKSKVPKPAQRAGR